MLPLRSRALASKTDTNRRPNVASCAQSGGHRSRGKMLSLFVKPYYELDQVW